MQREPKAAKNGLACFSLFGTSESWQSNSKVPTALSPPTFFRQAFLRSCTPVLVPSLKCFQLWKKAQIGVWAYREKSCCIGPALRFHAGWGMGWTLLVL